MTDRARPDLPAHHPQNVPLSKWSSGWLKMSVAGHVGVDFIVAHEHEKRAAGWPVTDAEMVDFLTGKGDVPAAGA